MAKPALKVLFAGDVGGRVEALFKRVEAVNASSGPFDLLLCAGGFFGGSGRSHGAWRDVRSPMSLVGGRKSELPVAAAAACRLPAACMPADPARCTRMQGLTTTRMPES